jgi:predicted cupin superfamily sugar epimerase
MTETTKKTSVFPIFHGPIIQRMKTAQYWIEQLHLQQHPEGGFYKETYRAAELIPRSGLPTRFPADRTHATAIYFLLRAQDRSLFHRIKSDELWHYHAGGSLTIYVLHDGQCREHILGADIEKGESLQIVVPANCWFGARVNPEPSAQGYVLSGCTVAPGFDFADFELADRGALLKEFPDQYAIIRQLTSESTIL